MVGVSEFLIQKRIQILLDSKFRDLYKILIRGMDKGSIGGLSISLICILYAAAFDPYIVPIFRIIGPLVFPALGTIYASELDNPRIAAVLRSSTDEGDHGASRDHQFRRLERERDRVDGEFVEIIDRVESAATMDRKSIDEILELAENDEIDVVAVMEVDRLTRAPVFEAISFYQKLEERDCILYVDAIGYIDWDDLNDIQMLLNQTVFGRKWYLRIQEGRAGSVISELKEGKYPYGGSPLGFETDEDHNIWVRDDEREFMYRAFKTYVRVENRQQARRELNKKREKQGKETISDQQLKTLLESRLCIGQFTHDGTIVNRDPNLRVIDRETFRRAQEILRERRTHENQPDLPDFMGRAVDRYGIEHIMSILESFPKRCRKCGSKLATNGRATVMGYTLKNYKCQNDNCNHQGPLLTEDEIQELHQTHPPRCVNCPATGQFDVEEVEGFDEYRYTCQICGHTFKDPLPPDKFERMIESPNEKFDVEQEYSPPQDTNSQPQSDQSKEAIDEPAKENQTTLSGFVT